MNDTYTTIVGNVLTAPEWRRTNTSGQLVANFRVAATSRRYDRDNNRWVDGDTLRIRVSAWRRLAEGVAASIRVGDPVIVYGRIYTRDWTDDESNPRVAYELEALAVGLDLSRGRARFYRTRALAALAVVEDTEAETMVGGEPADPVTDGQVPVRFGEGLPEPLPGETEPDFLEVVAGLTDPTDEPTEEPGEEPPADPVTTEVRRTRRVRREPVPA
ncbi:single-stranded DNA-binding protein [Actinoplanes sp. SE50]|uniref:single-stranded DNA-binding protein n=1 Tax=unclassified Actinoplanes TaxID=2626549 RepID=UPI00023ED1AE|nr:MULTISPECIES: single-stranded DNA-binding protein [unclassified Actinoplanes]AEV82187.1 Single-stranded DNA-binding protein [Actinoplanes sp. SE50/110]ATO80586.1 single-stranded DNA-binding protein [Actinoplanes sp. SE50]SLL97992.1 single-stranded DNA-binding protein [Actinoplanes sp. SE50/110]